MSEEMDTQNNSGAATLPHAEHYDPEGIKIGMWLFLITELMTFGGLFILYAMQSYTYRADFLAASGSELSRAMGAFNTVVLLTSSLTMALSINAILQGARKRSMVLLGITIACALIFFGVKYFEWTAKFHHGVYPGSEHWVNELNNGTRTFFTLYFSMTGLHGVHLFIGLCLLIWCLVRIQKGQITPERHMMLENCGLFWHLIDLVWIFLFPLFYLIA